MLHNDALIMISISRIGKYCGNDRDATSIEDISKRVYMSFSLSVGVPKWNVRVTSVVPSVKTDYIKNAVGLVMV